MIQRIFKSIFGRCLLALAIFFFSVIISFSQEQATNDPPITEKKEKIEDQQVFNVESEIIQKKNDIPIGLFAYNKWVDLNENEIVERNEFFGLGKESFSKGESISATLYDPKIKEGTSLKLRIWDTGGNLIRTIRKIYTSNPMFSYSNFDSFLPVGDYILTINPENNAETYQINFSLKEPNGKAFLKIRKKLLPESFHLFEEWIDEDGDMKMDSTEVLGLNQYQFDLGNVNFQIGLNLPMSNQEVVYQIWNSKYDLIAMNISKMDSLQHYTMNRDTLSKGNEFLRILKEAPAGEYMITASLGQETPKQYRLLVQVNDTIKNLISDPETEDGAESEPELVVVTDSLPEVPKMAMGLSENVDNMAPNFKKGQEGFFFFTGFIDLNENNKQEREEFMGADQDYYYSESENVFVQFHLMQFFDKELNLKIIDAKENLVREQIGSYGDSPFVFKISMPDDPLIPGNYQLIMQPGDSEIRYRLELEIK